MSVTPHSVEHVFIQGRIYSNPGPVQKKVGPPRAPAGIFARGEPEGLGTEVPQRCPGAEADGILLKMTYTDIAFLMWGPHFCGGPCLAEHAEHA